jgi:hypothetical protein
MVTPRPRYGERPLTEVREPDTETGGGESAASRTVSLELDEFGMEAFAEFAKRQGAPTSRVAAMAARYYLADSGHAHPAWRVPSSAQPGGPERGHAPLRVELDAPTWEALLSEARRQSVDIGVLAAHAVLYFMTDIDSGRVAARMAEAMDERRGG